MQDIRNFVIIAHIDHGKSTLADRMLEVTGTVEARRMKPQYLDQLDLERERGITIKMAPVRMEYAVKGSNGPCVFNLIDTPGHSDFSYEVSRALAAVEGAVLLVDVTKGIQAQTLSNLRSARQVGLTVIGAVNKVDLDSPNLEKTIEALANLLEVPQSEILRISGKTGIGVAEVLDAVFEKVPPPKSLVLSSSASARATVFDSLYDDHKGILAYVRVLEGEIRAGDDIFLLAPEAKVKIKEVGYFSPELKTSAGLKAGEIGYIATGLKEPSFVKIGDTFIKSTDDKAKARDFESLRIKGYREATPVVFISFYPDGQTKFEDLYKGFSRLRLTDAALNFEPDANEALGRGLKVGFLGQLHFDITASRLTREFGLEFMTSFPSIAYRVVEREVSRMVNDAHDFPDHPDQVFQPMIRIEILAPATYLNSVLGLKNVFEMTVDSVQSVGDNVSVIGTMPLAELIRDFDDQLKSLSAGYASFSYELAGEAPAEVEKLEVLIANDVASALTRVVPRKDIERESRATVDRLKKLLPAQQFTQSIQARAFGRIIARENIAAMKKDVTGYLYGGDRSRKMKLWKKQKRGKERLKETGRVNLSVEVFREILRK